MSSRAIPFEAGHLELAEFGGRYARGFLEVPDGIEKIRLLAEAGQTLTFIRDGRILCFAGVFECWKGVLEVWATPTIYIEKHPLSFCRRMKRYLLQIEGTYNAVRVQTSAVSTEEYDRWMQWLGFECEGILRNYTGTGTDYKMWSRVK